MTNNAIAATSLPMMIENFSCWLKEFYLNEIDNNKKQQQHIFKETKTEEKENFK